GLIVQGANDSDGDPTFYVIGTHIYDVAGEYDFSVSVSTPGYEATTGDGTATVSSAPLIAQSAAIARPPGGPLPSDTVVATYTTTGPVPDPSSFADGTVATINWGDGTALDTGTVTYAGTSPTDTVFVVTGEHTYENITDVFQAYQVSVTIETPDGSA